jgi:Helix-hairpin-helix motif
MGGRCGHRCGQNSISQTLLKKILVNLPATGANPEGPLLSNWEICIERPKIVLILSVCTLLLSGCFDSNNTHSLEQHTADATAAAKRDAAAIARGVVEGLARKGPMDINTASTHDLEKLPDVSAAEAQAIIAGRPYDNTSQLVKRHILSKPQYNAIRAQIGVK